MTLEYAFLEPLTILAGRHQPSDDDGCIVPRTLLSWLRRIFSSTEGNASDEPSPIPLGMSDYASRFISVPGRNFFGLHSISPDGRFTLAWRDGNDECTVSGFRESGEGQCLLLESGKVVASSRAERPNDGKVANDGTYIVNDWLFGGELNGRLRAFDRRGNTIVDHFFAANLSDNGLSADGRFAICQTANSPGSDDSELIALFDLREGRLLARWHPESGQAVSFEFDADRQELIAHYRDGEIVRFTFSGAMVDREGWIERRITRGDLAVIGPIVRDDNEGWREKSDHLLAGLDAAVERDEIFLDRSRAMRLKGELFERLSREADALEAYDAALLIDPQVGVSRRADALRKKLRPADSKASSKLSRFERQAQTLGIEHEFVQLEGGGSKEWRCEESDPWVCVEEAVLVHYERQGWTGVAAEGGLVLTLIKAASFDPLPLRSADTFIEALYAQNVAFAEDRHDVAKLVDNVATASMKRIESNWRIISATAGHTPAFYPRVHWPNVKSLFEALGPTRLSDIARIFATGSYNLRAGWPDLTLWRESEVRFVEVKSPNDQFHASQSRLISSLLVPLGLRTGLAEVRRRGAGKA